MVAAFADRLSTLLGRNRSSTQYGTNVACSACGVINRRALSRADRSCWSCSEELPLVATPGESETRQPTEIPEQVVGHSLP